MDKEDLLYLLRDPEVRRTIFKIVCHELLEVVKRESKGGQSVAEYAIQSAIESAVQTALASVGVKSAGKKFSDKKHGKDFVDDFDDRENFEDNFEGEENFDSEEEDFHNRKSRRRSRDYDEDDDEDYHERKSRRRRSRDYDDEDDFEDDDYRGRRSSSRGKFSSDTERSMSRREKISASEMEGDDNIKIPARQRGEKISDSEMEGDDNIKFPARQRGEKISDSEIEGDDNIKIPARQRGEKISASEMEGDDNIKIPSEKSAEKVPEEVKPKPTIDRAKLAAMAATAAKASTDAAEREKVMAMKEKMWRDIEERKKAAPKTEDLVASLLAQQKAKTVEQPAPPATTLRTVKEIVIPAQEHNHESATHESIDKFTLVLERPCPVCENLTRVVKTKTRQIVDTRDVDLCIHYKSFNPYLYYVWACENCGFAAEETRFLSPMPKRTRGKIKSFLISNNLVMPFLRERNVQDAMSFYEMAILFSEAFEPSMGRQAGLYQKMAWIQRYEGNKEKELEYLRKTAELYEESFGKERYPIGNVSDTTALYVTAATYFLLGEYEKSTKILSRIIENQSLRSSNPNLYDRARDLWQDIRKNKGVK